MFSIFFYCEHTVAIHEHHQNFVATWSKSSKTSLNCTVCGDLNHQSSHHPKYVTNPLLKGIWTPPAKTHTHTHQTILHMASFRVGLQWYFRHLWLCFSGSTHQAFSWHCARPTFCPKDALAFALADLLALLLGRPERVRRGRSLPGRAGKRQESKRGSVGELELNPTWWVRNLKETSAGPILDS